MCFLSQERKQTSNEKPFSFDDIDTNFCRKKNKQRINKIYNQNDSKSSIK